MLVVDSNFYVMKERCRVRELVVKYKTISRNRKNGVTIHVHTMKGFEYKHGQYDSAEGFYK